MNKPSEFMVQNRAFLDIASQFGFGKNKNKSNSKLDSSNKIDVSSKSDIIDEDDADKSNNVSPGSKTSESATTSGKLHSDSGREPNDSSNFNKVVLELLRL